MISYYEEVQFTRSCGCVGCDLKLPVIDGNHGKGDKSFACRFGDDPKYFVERCGECSTLVRFRGQR